MLDFSYEKDSSWMNDIHCVCTCTGDVYGATIEHEHDALVNWLQWLMSI